MRKVKAGLQTSRSQSSRLSQYVSQRILQRQGKYHQRTFQSLPNVKRVLIHICNATSTQLNVDFD